MGGWSWTLRGRQFRPWSMGGPGTCALTEQPAIGTLVSVLHGSEVATQQPLPRLGSGNADIARASKLTERVNDFETADVSI